METHNLLGGNYKMAIFRTLTSVKNKCFAGDNQLQAWICSGDRCQGAE